MTLIREMAHFIGFFPVSLPNREIAGLVEPHHPSVHRGGHAAEYHCRER
ncbi:hypothetical protein [Streptomyces bungoensis]|nr:hypothetical protein [Streptomyces bungoensis]